MISGNFSLHVESNVWMDMRVITNFLLLISTYGAVSDGETAMKTHNHGEGHRIALLDLKRRWKFAGSLITWTKVITTCTAVRSQMVTYANFRGNDQVLGWYKKVTKAETDPRCLNRTVSNYLRYNVGVFHLDSQPVESNVIKLLQYPSPSKQKYLRLTDQVINRRLNCSVSLTAETGLKEIRLRMMPSSELSRCREFDGLHEFMCAVRDGTPIEGMASNQGSPILCGEDAYGILVAPENVNELKNLSELDKSTTAVIMRLDEFTHLMVEPDITFDFYS